MLDTRRNVASIEIGDIPHTSHTLNWVNPDRPGVPKFLQSVVVTSPARLMMHSFKVVASACEKVLRWTQDLLQPFEKQFIEFGILESWMSRLQAHGEACLLPLIHTDANEFLPLPNIRCTYWEFSVTPKKKLWWLFWVPRICCWMHIDSNSGACPCFLHVMHPIAWHLRR